MKNKIKFSGILVLGLAIVVLALILLQVPTPPVEEGIKKFNNVNEIKNFLKENTGYGGYGEVMVAATEAAKSTETTRAEDYSTTNIQVQGVDEADIVKNDDKYIYVVSGKKVVIVDAFPAQNMGVLSEIDINRSINEIFINDDKLIVFSSGYGYVVAENFAAEKVGSYYSNYKNFVYVYDISNREEPELEREIEIDGNYKDSRMIDNFVYVISQKYASIDNPEPPVYILDGEEIEVKANEVYYFPYYDINYVFTSIMALNINSDETEIKTYLTGYTYTIYVSQDNIYLTGQKRIPYTRYLERYVEEVIMPLLPSEEKDKVEEILDSNEQVWKKMNEIQEIVYDYSTSLEGEEKEDFDKELQENLEEFEEKIQKEMEKTVIHRIQVNKDNINYKKSGEVPGNVLNQFSLDEYKEHFRIATTTGNWRDNSLNHIYVLNNNLEITGKVEDLAKGERIYSVRFLGDRAYMVTFRQVDPLFVVDLENPSKPEVLGYLKVTGFSSYLHPYDENHIIGIGKEATEEGRVQGLKIALFDVSDVENPEEIAKYEIEIDEGWSDSYALYEHKAFLFSKNKNLLVIPVLISDWKNNNYWQGAYVFDINLEGIELKGKITHKENETESYWYGPFTVQRSLYMENVLYTISTGRIKANNLETVEEIKSIDLPYEQDYYPIYRTSTVNVVE